MIGWIKLHRCIEENFLYLSERFTKAQAWTDLLILAGHQSGSAMIRGIEIKLAPGELCWSQVSLAKRWKWDPKTVSSFLKLLSNHNMIIFKNSKITTIVTICNWAKYQAIREIIDDEAENKTENRTENKTENRTGTNKKERNLKNYYEHKVLKNLSEENKENGNGKNQQYDPYSVKSRLAYRTDPEKSKARLEELKKIFGDN